VLLQMGQGDVYSWQLGFKQFAFVLGLNAIAWLGMPVRVQGKWMWPWVGTGLGLLFVMAGISYTSTGNTLAGWGVVTGVVVMALWLDDVFAHEQPWWVRVCVHGTTVMLAAAAPLLIAQVESHFSDEEFFVALQFIEFVVLITVFWWSHKLLRAVVVRPNNYWLHHDLVFRLAWLPIPLMLFVVGGGYVSLRAYQASFSPAIAPSYPGINADHPFMCGTASTSGPTYDGKQVFAQYMSLLAANPNKGSPELGMLALDTNDDHWAQAFRQSLLSEAAHEHYTGSVNSVKFGQSDAALRIYYYLRMTQHFPALFSQDEEQSIHQWLAQVNRDAYQVGWVDWLYAFAFARKPGGLYQNQEIGPGLVSLLSQNQLGATNLAQTNRDYLTNNAHDWTRQFRNTDDTLFYQNVWINNKVYQLLAGAPVLTSTVQLSFDWLLLQALPDGKPFGYNHPDPFSLAGVSYLGAVLLHDPHYIWLAGRSLSASSPSQIVAQPGVERAVDLVGQAPTQGTCLLYGDTGSPTQPGALGPDKIAFRDGWDERSAYMLLNLRFTGWHRYKATNTVTLVYGQGELASDDMNAAPLAWLPTGRSAFRDKRIPRERLNGLLVERTGLDAVIRDLLGGSVWAQDPPYFATVTRFLPGEQVDQSTTVLESWHGWTQARSIAFYHSGPIVITDQITGTLPSRAALAWHIPAGAQDGPQRYTVRDGPNPVQMVVLTLDSSIQPQVQLKLTSSGRQVTIEAEQGRMSLATIFLIGPWFGAQVSLHGTPGHRTLVITGAGTGSERTIALPITSDPVPAAVRQ
jgi:hypothetical protein